MRCIEVAREIVQHLLGDDAFLEGTEANRLLVELALGREVIRYTKRKTVSFSVRHHGTENADRGSHGYVFGGVSDWHLYPTSMSCCSGN